MPASLRFRRRIRIAPGVSLNLSRSGLSTTVGRRGLHYTVGHGGRRATVGIPGTGLSYTAYSPAHARQAVRGRRATAAAATPRAVTGTKAQPLLPSQKIALGIVLTLLVLTAPVGIPMLVTGLLQRTKPRWRVRTLVSQAARKPARSRELLDRAFAIDPHNPEALAPLAEWHYLHDDDRAALPLFQEYLRAVPGDMVAHAHLANCSLQLGLADLAVTEFQQVREGAALAEESRASVTAHLAAAFLAKGDPVQAAALLGTEPLRKHQLGPGLQQCLYYRAAAKYLAGSRRAAVADIDRLYAINAAYPAVEATKAAMENGSFVLSLPSGRVLPPESAAAPR